MGSSVHEHCELAEVVGRVVATEGHHLLTGAGGGVMEAASRAFVATRDRLGLSIGVVRAGGDGHLTCNEGIREYVPRRPPNPYVEVPIITHLPLSGDQGKHPLSRNHINVLTSDLLVMLPGEKGTRSELELGLEYRKPLIVFLGEREIDGMNAGAVGQLFGSRVQIVQRPESLAEAIRRGLASPQR